MDQSKRWWWLGWSWKAACASYLVGLITFVQLAIIMIWWSTVLFTPLIAVTLYMTRSRRLAQLGIPVVVAAISASAYLWFSGIKGAGLPGSPLFLGVWIIGLLGPFVLFFVVSRHLAALQKAAEPRVN